MIIGRAVQFEIICQSGDDVRCNICGRNRVWKFKKWFSLWELCDITQEKVESATGTISGHRLYCKNNLKVLIMIFRRKILITMV